MKNVEVTVTNNQGERQKALKLVCEDCGGDQFHIFVLFRGAHNHLQCAKCAKSYCDGSCALDART